MSNSLKQLRTPFGLVSADIKTTYHVNWLTYAHDRTAGQYGLEDIVEKAYGKSVELSSSNDTNYSCTVQKEELSKYDQNRLEALIKLGCAEDYDLDLIMQDLANKEILPEGAYVVTVSW